MPSYPIDFTGVEVDATAASPGARHAVASSKCQVGHYMSLGSILSHV